MALSRPPSASTLPPDLDPRDPRRTPPLARRAGVPLRRLRTAACVLIAIVAIGTAAAVLAVAATGYGVLRWSDSSIKRVDAFGGLHDRPARSADGSSTFLLVGTDGREGLSAAQQRHLHVGSEADAAGRRADTMLLMHVSPALGTVSVVSLPRDSYVTIPAHKSLTDGTEVPERRNKLNAAYAFGGPQLTVATVERSTGVRVDHYVEVDFLGFVKLVDAVGGVDVCSPTRLRDRLAGLRLPKGVTHVNGRRGLAYVRARHVDARADLGRIERQQRFLGAMAARVTSRDVLLDPRTLVRFLKAAMDTVRADDELSEKEMVSLATELRHATGGDVRFRTVPIADPSYRARDGQSVALWDPTGSREVFDAMREDRAPARKLPGSGPRLTVPPDQVRVQVYNGSGTVGLGTQASRELANGGFGVVGIAQNWRSNAVKYSLLRYDSRYTASIKTLAAAVPGARLVPVDGLGRTLQLVIGGSYGGIRPVHVATATGPAGDPVERTAAADPCS
jgi:LCP family protein required for cell wall assembly